jgi:predicted dehydrogenase
VFNVMDDCSMTRNAPIKTVIAGLGRAGWDIHWRSLLRHNPAYRVVGVIESLPERRREAEAEMGCAAFAGWEEFLERPIGDLVIIATPSGGHGPEALACLRQGLHVVVDKPMCQGVAEADAMIALARAKRLVLSVYHPYRLAPCFLKMQAIVRSGRLGRIVEIKCNRSAFYRRNDWVMKKARGGGLHNVWGSHTVDQCLQLINSPAQDVFSDLQCTVTPGDADDHCKIVLRCENGTLIDAEISNCFAFPPQPEWTVAGTCGGIVTSDKGLHLKYFDPSEAPPIGMVEGPAIGRKYLNDDALPWKEEFLPNPDGPGTAAFYPSVCDAIRHGAPLIITPESVRETIRVLEICRQQNPRIWAGY